MLFNIIDSLFMGVGFVGFLVALGIVITIGKKVMEWVKMLLGLFVLFALFSFFM